MNPQWTPTIRPLDFLLKSSRQNMELCWYLRSTDTLENLFPSEMTPSRLETSAIFPQVDLQPHHRSSARGLRNFDWRPQGGARCRELPSRGLWWLLWRYAHRLVPVRFALKHRAKYPNIVIGGLAASAPFGFVGTGVPPEAFTLACTATFEDAQTGCGAAVTEFWQAFQVATESQAGLEEISTQMGLCAPLQSANDAENLLGWVLGGLQDMAMLDYPYATNYGIPVVAWPVNATCKRLLGSIKQDGPLAAMAYAIGTFYNATGQYSCYNITADNPVWGTGDGWPYLACTSVYMPSASAGMFPPAAWNETYDAQSCAEQFSVELQPLWPVTHWGGFSSFVPGVASNIIFSNGLLDPWHTSGILESPSEADGLVAIVIPESAHHLDLRAPNPADPPYVTAARAQEDALIGQWLSDFFQNN